MQELKCWNWEENCPGVLSEQYIHYKCTTKNRIEISIPNLLVVKCNQCSDYWLDGPACRLIDDEIRKLDPDFGKKYK